MREHDTAQALLRPMPETDSVGDEPEENPLEWKKEKPQLNVKAKGLAGYVGNGWLRTSKYGKYIRVFLRSDLPKGTVLFVSPRRDHEGLLGQ